MPTSPPPWEDSRVKRKVGVHQPPPPSSGGSALIGASSAAQPPAAAKFRLFTQRPEPAAAAAAAAAIDDVPAAASSDVKAAGSNSGVAKVASTKGTHGSSLSEGAALGGAARAHIDVINSRAADMDSGITSALSFSSTTESTAHSLRQHHNSYNDPENDEDDKDDDDDNALPGPATPPLARPSSAPARLRSLNLSGGAENQVNTKTSSQVHDAVESRRPVTGDPHSAVSRHGRANAEHAARAARELGLDDVVWGSMRVSTSVVECRP
jgi:hypothetical protein